MMLFKRFPSKWRRTVCKAKSKLVSLFGYSNRFNTQIQFALDNISNYNLCQIATESKITKFNTLNPLAASYKTATKSNTAFFNRKREGETELI